MKNLFEISTETLSRSASKTVLVSGNETLTFGELHAQSQRVAAALHANGITPGQIVPILLPRGIEPLVALFGVWQLGAAACLLDTTYPEDRIQAIREDCGTDFLVDADWFQKAFHQNIDQIEFPAFSPQPNDLALLVFTSGSTGKPKGVMLPWRVVNITAANHFLIFREDDVFLSAAPFAFAAILPIVVGVFAHGMTVHIADNVTRKDVVLFADYIRKHQITASALAPAMGPAFLQIADGQLRTLLMGSDRVRNIFSTKTKCYCGYGASETGSTVCRFEIDQPYSSSTPIGYPQPGSRIYLLDENDQPVKQGEKGEICVSGQIALGYLNRPELTAERFVPNPFAEGEHDKILFRTNDIGRILPNGALEYVERKDWMIKIRGNRVEPGEIEKVMLDCATQQGTPLDKAVVVGFSDKSGETKLYACYTAKESVDPVVLRESIASKLPDYMLPAFLEQVDSLPVNINGKIDRTQIAPPDVAKYQVNYVAPTNESERLLCDAFAKVLDLPQVGIHDDFVQLGGDSISAVAVQLFLPKSMQISVAALTALRTPQRIAQEGVTETIPIAGDRKEWKVTYDEELFLRIQERNPMCGSTVIVNSALSLSGKLDVVKLENSIRQLLSKNRVLRSVYNRNSMGNFVRTLSEIPEVVLRHIRCTADQVMNEIARRHLPFDIAVGPLYRFVLFETGPERYILCSSISHSVIDGLGIQILWDELADIYSGRATKSSEQTPDFLDFAEWRETSSRYDTDKGFYDQMFADGFELNKMPWRTPTVPEPTFADGMAKNVLDANTLEKGVRQFGGSVFSSLIGAMGLMLGKYCCTNDVVLFFMMNTRFYFSELVKAHGMLAEHFPIRVKWEKEQTLSSFLKKTDDLLNKIQRHLACGGLHWSRERYPGIDFSSFPFMLVNYRRKIIPPLFQGLNSELYPIPPMGTQPIVQSMIGVIDYIDNNLNAIFCYPTASFDVEIAEAMNDYFVYVLQKIAEGEDVCLGDL